NSLLENSIIPYAKPSKNVRELHLTDLHLVAYVDDEAFYKLSDEDGKSYAFIEGKNYLTNLKIAKKAEDYERNIDNNNPYIKNININIIDSNNNINHKEI